MTGSSKASQAISSDTAKRHCDDIGAKSPVPYGVSYWRMPEAEPVLTDAPASHSDRFNSGSSNQSGNRIDPDLVERALGRTSGGLPPERN